MSNTEDNKLLYRRFVQEIFNEGRLEKIEELLSPDYVFRDPPLGASIGREGLAPIVVAFRAAFPDLKITVDEQVAEGNRVFSLNTMRATHKGVFNGIPPSGRSVIVCNVAMVRVANGRLIESLVKGDTMSLLTQIGALPARG